MKVPSYKIIFEGAELAGKSYLMQQVFDYLEPKYNSGGKTMDGCHWFNCDVGIFGTSFGEIALNKYLELMEELVGANVIVEKFHLTEAVYQKLYNQRDFALAETEKRLAKIDAKIILVTFPEDEEILKKRLQDRLCLYPNYQRIVQTPADYIRQQQLYLKLLEKSKLPNLILETRNFSPDNLVKQVLKFLGEK